MSFPVYASDKDSGVEWLGRVPSHWEVRRLELELEEIDVRAEDRPLDLLGLSKSAGIVPRSDLTQGAAESDNYGKYKEVRPGDLVMNKMQAWNGVFGLSALGGMVSPDYSVFDVLRPSYASFICEALRTEMAAGELFTRCRGMGTAFLRLNSSDFLDVRLAFPPAEEVRAIAAFLHRETGKVDALVEAQRRLIELLKEKRHAVISHAVTKGLAPAAPMKDSGVEWLGEVPVHWEVTALKHSWSVTDCKHVTAGFVDEGVPLASIREVQSRFVDLRQAKQTTDDYYALLIEGGRKPTPGDLIFSRNATVGEVAEVDDTHPLFAMGQDVCLLRRRGSSTSSAYLYHVIRSQIVREQLAVAMIGSTFKRVNVEQIRSLIIPVPPTEEQARIAVHVEGLIANSDALIGQAEAAIALLQERRAALISAAVTGKIDVRGLVTEQAEAA